MGSMGSMVVEERPPEKGSGKPGMSDLGSSGRSGQGERDDGQWAVAGSAFGGPVDESEGVAGSRSTSE